MGGVNEGLFPQQKNKATTVSVEKTKRTTKVKFPPLYLNFNIETIEKIFGS